MKNYLSYNVDTKKICSYNKFVIIPGIRSKIANFKMPKHVYTLSPKLSKKNIVTKIDLLQAYH